MSTTATQSQEQDLSFEEQISKQCQNFAPQALEILAEIAKGKAFPGCYRLRHSDIVACGKLILQIAQGAQPQLGCSDYERLERLQEKRDRADHESEEITPEEVVDLTDEEKQIVWNFVKNPNDRFSRSLAMVFDQLLIDVHDFCKRSNDRRSNILRLATFVHDRGRLPSGESM